MTLPRLFGHGFIDQFFQFFRNRCIKDMDWRWRLAAYAIARSHETVGQEGVMAGQNFVEHNSQGENVGTAIGSVLHQDLGRHVGERSAHSARPVDCGALVGLGKMFGDAEI